MNDQSGRFRFQVVTRLPDKPTLQRDTAEGRAAGRKRLERVLAQVREHQTPAKLQRFLSPLAALSSLLHDRRPAVGMCSGLMAIKTTETHEPRATSPSRRYSARRIAEFHQSQDRPSSVPRCAPCSPLHRLHLRGGLREWWVASISDLSYLCSGSSSRYTKTREFHFATAKRCAA
eukprot:SAG11_NODE_5449_length_1556_cov_1.273850_3_plen_174_part_01